MAALEESCLELQQILNHTEQRCQTILTNLDEFEKYCASYAMGRLRKKLDILGSWITGLAELRYEEHQNQGYVCVFMRVNRGFEVVWVEDKEIVADKAYYKQYGSTVLSVEEAANIIIDKMNELASGKWASVVEWSKLYAKSPGLDFDKYR